MSDQPVHWLEERFNARMAEHEQKVDERVKALETAMRDAGEQVMNLVKENEAVRGDLSQALAERNQAREEIARLRIDLKSTEEDRFSVIHERNAAQAALGRAVAALQRVKRDHELSPREWLLLEVEIDTVLADPTSAQAGAYVTALEEAVEATRKAKACYCALPNCPALAELDVKLSAVDARRGGGR
jgi:chromosome segregation ATPase